MKRILLFVFIFCLMMAGCNKTKQCEEYAPAWASVSWTDYNTVKQVRDYFACHSATLNSHLGDTIKICGYCTSSVEDMMIDNMYLSQEPNKTAGELINVSLYKINNLRSVLQEATADGNTKVYVVGTVSVAYLIDDGGLGCCGEALDIIALDINKEAL